MRVYIVWEKYFNYLDSIEYAFEANGCQTKTYTVKRFKRNTTKLKKFANKLGYKKFAKEYSYAVSNDIYSQCTDFKADVFLMINGNFTEIIEEQKLLDIKNSGVKMVLWFIDSIKNYKLSAEYIALYDEIFSFERLDIDFIKKTYGRDASYLPVGAAEEIYKYVPNTERTCDICFVGTKDSRRLSTLEHVAKYCVEHGKNMQVYGYLWQNRDWVQSTLYASKFKKQYPNLYKFTTNERMQPEQTATLYNRSKINLNITVERHHSTNPRTFEILAAGGFQILDYHQGCDELFEDKKELVWYRNNDELIELLDYYLAHDQEREVIAQKGHEVTTKKYLMRHIVRKIMGQ